MGVTQYIGARYVPIFAEPAEWTSARTYEPLTIVMHEGNSYTSKQFVPVGININNEQFWALTGNYNAQVEAYRQEVINVSNQIVGITDSVDKEAKARQDADAALQNNIDKEAQARTAADTTLQGNIDKEATARQNGDATLQGNIDKEATARQNGDATLQGNIDKEAKARQDADAAMQRSIDQIETVIDDKIDDLGKATKKRIAVYIGNSYALGTGSTGNNRGIFELTKDYFDEAYLIWASGAGFSEYSGHSINQTFQGLIETANTSSDFKNSDVTDIIYISAMGDTRAICEKKSLTQAMQTTISNAQKYFPNAQQHIYFAEIIGKKNAQDSYSKLYPIAQVAVHCQFQWYAAQYNYVYHGWGGWNYNFDTTQVSSTDYYHPNDTGYTNLSRAFMKSLKYGKVHYKMKHRTMYSTAQDGVGGRADWAYIMDSPTTGTVRLNNIRSDSAPYAKGTAYTGWVMFNPNDVADNPVMWPSIFNRDIIALSQRGETPAGNIFGTMTATTLASENSGQVNINFTPNEGFAANAPMSGSGNVYPVNMWVSQDMSIS